MPNEKKNENHFSCLIFIIRDEFVKFLDFPFLINIKLFFFSLLYFFLFLRTFLRLSIFSKYQFHADVLFVPCTLHTRKYRHILLPFFFTISFYAISLKIYTCAIAYMSYIHLHVSMLHLSFSFLCICPSYINIYKLRETHISEILSL